ncbi:MAG: glycosyltransferase [Rhodobacteraceae bacterium]|nr:glycosyltransferase [Paracoccaceae bacterium]
MDEGPLLRWPPAGGSFSAGEARSEAAGTLPRSPLPPARAGSGGAAEPLPASLPEASSPESRLLADLAAHGLLRQGRRALVSALLQREARSLPGILRSHRLVAEAPLARALAREAGLASIDLDLLQPDPGLRASASGGDCLQAGAIPWREAPEGVIMAIADPGRADAARAALDPARRLAGLVTAPEEQIRRHILRLHAQAMVDAAHRLCPQEASCRDLAIGKLGPILLLTGIAFLVMWVLAGPGPVMLVLLGFSLLVLAANTALRVLAVGTRLRTLRLPGPPPPPPPVRLPVVSLLVPLHREAAILPRLRERLARIDYPPALLDLCFIVEQEDHATRAALMSLDPAEAQVIVVPEHGLKTKPLAMNYALPFTRGAIVGIYDAEDAPDPGQVARAVAHLAAAPPRVACVQSRLGFYNAPATWLTRCFALDYGTWYGIVLPGLHALGGVLPLGGTSLFFRREALEAVGGWDAHNVTEDADLGLRLARNGWRVDLLDSETLEEAVARPWAWVRQRSRWIKGFLLTWAVHMRSPGRLLRELGLWRFLGVQVLLLGGPLSALTAPILWGMAALALGGSLPGLNALPVPLLWGMGLFMALAQIVFMASSMLAVSRRGRRWLMPWIMALPFYYLLATVAALKAVAEVAVLPFFWDKTDHGIDRPAPGTRG